MAGELLKLVKLSKHYKGGRGIGPVSLELEPGIHALLGPNGSGKTTLIQTLLGFHRQFDGQATILGQSVGVNLEKIRESIGYMAEQDVIVPLMSGIRTVRLAAELSGFDVVKAAEAADEALDMVGIGEERYRFPSQLSTGQRQQVKLAAAIVHKPRLLILDEPTNGLDPSARQHMLDLIQKLHKESGTSVLLSTHILPDVQALCEKAIIINNGSLVAVDSVRNVADDHDRYFVTFDGEVNHVLADLPQTVTAARHKNGILFEGEPNSVIRVLKKHGYKLQSLEPSEDSGLRSVKEKLEGTA